MPTEPDPYAGETDPQYEPDPRYDEPAYAVGGQGIPDRSEASSKKLAAGLCAILLAGLGIHKFILGYTNAGVIMLVVTVASATIGSCLIFPFLAVIAMSVISIAEGIIYLTKSDEEFYQTYMVGRKEWF